MPCNTCGKDSGNFYEGSCPDCLMVQLDMAEARVRELDAQVTAMRELLRIAEWVWYPAAKGDHCCFDCGYSKDEGHGDGCDVAKALDGDGKKEGENEHVAYTNPAPTF